jgi:hypothetical protein
MPIGRRAEWFPESEGAVTILESSFTVCLKRISPSLAALSVFLEFTLPMHHLCGGSRHIGLHRGARETR